MSIKNYLKAGEMNEQLKTLLPKHEDGSSDPRTYPTSKGTVQCTAATPAPRMAEKVLLGLAGACWGLLGPAGCPLS